MNSSLAPEVVGNEERSPTLGRMIFNRIGNIERARLQTRFLQLLSTLPVWDQLVFRGAVAIHGVYLHGRSSPDLDFLAPAEVKERFVEIMRSQGISLQEKEDARIPYFSMRGTVFQDVAIGVDVCERESHLMTWNWEQFQGANGLQIPVRVMPLALLMAEKLRATSRRSRPNDFFDFWLFCQKRPDLLPELQRALHIGSVDGEDLEFDAHDTWNHFQETRSYWHERLIAHMPTVPSFERVETDLGRVLESFKTA